MIEIAPFGALYPARFDRPDILKKLTAASRRLAELKGLAASIPNQGILINALGLQEAKDSSAIENIVTTHDELLTDPRADKNPATKEVRDYVEALRIGYALVQETKLLTNNH